ncbi:MAG: AAA family ATPase [Gammaproteobacteria bacterium]|nr:AAA family ATPase [Gammaproteobacteria bacterium]
MARQRSCTVTHAAWRTGRASGFASIVAHRSRRDATPAVQSDRRGAGSAVPAARRSKANLTLPSEPRPSAARRRARPWTPPRAARPSGVEPTRSQRLDPEDLRVLMTAYQQTCKAAVERYDGFVARYMGDGVLAYFGYPKAHEDDAERSVRTALSLIESISSLETPGAGGADTPLAVRIGIATGRVVVGDLIGENASRENPVVGETPNLAARLQQLASPGTVLVSAGTRALLGDRFEAEELDECRLKGIEQPVRPWRIVRERAAQSRFWAARGRRLTPLVGREEEIDTLLRRWRRAVRGEGQVVVVSGEPGIGKSRLAETLCDRIASEPHLRLRYQCSPHHVNSAFYPVITQMRHAAGLGAKDAPATRLEKLRALLGKAVAAPDEKDDLSVVAALLSVPPPDAASLPADAEELKSKTLAALIRQLEGLTGDVPVLAIFEDVHWIDPSTLELLDRIVAHAADLAVLVVVTCRPEFEAAWIGQAHVSLLALNRMDPRRSRELVGKLPGLDSVTDVVVDDIVAKADGVPLFIEELAWSVAGSAQSARGAAESVPATLHDSLMARLDRLAVARPIAQAGAVVGREFSVALVASVCGVSGETLDSSLEELVDSGLVHLRGSEAESAVCVFKHALIRDAAYQSLVREERRRLHARVAAVLAAEHPERTAASPELLAYHAFEAGDVAAAREHWRRAGRLSAARAAHAEAIDHCTRALAAHDALPDALRDAVIELDLLMELAQSMRVVERFDEAMPVLSRAEAVAARLDDLLALARIDNLRGNLHFPLGAAQACIDAHGRALDCARRAGSARAEATALSGLGDGEYARGRMLSAFENFRRCIDIATEHGFDDIVAANLGMVAACHLYQNEVDAGIEAASRGVDLARRSGQLRAELNSLVCLHHMLIERAETQTLRENSQRISEIVERLGTSSFQADNLAFLAKAYRAEGDRALALETAERAYEISRRLRPTFFGPRALGEIALCTDDPARRDRALEEGEALLRQGCVGHNYLWFYRDAIDACIACSQWDRAMRYADALDAYTSSEPLPWSNFWIARGRALAAFGRGEHGDALLRELRRLHDEATSVGLALALPAIDKALTSKQGDRRTPR